MHKNTEQRTYEVGSSATEDVLTLGDFNELIWKIVSGIAIFASRAQLNVEATHRVVAHLKWKAIFL